MSGYKGIKVVYTRYSNGSIVVPGINDNRPSTVAEGDYSNGLCIFSYNSREFKPIDNLRVLLSRWEGSYRRELKDLTEFLAGLSPSELYFVADDRLFSIHDDSFRWCKSLYGIDESTRTPYRIPREESEKVVNWVFDQVKETLSQ